MSQCEDLESSNAKGTFLARVVRFPSGLDAMSTDAEMYTQLPRGQGGHRECWAHAHKNFRDPCGSRWRETHEPSNLGAARPRATRVCISRKTVQFVCLLLMLWSMRCNDISDAKKCVKRRLEGAANDPSNRSPQVGG